MLCVRLGIARYLCGGIAEAAAEMKCFTLKISNWLKNNRVDNNVSVTRRETCPAALTSYMVPARTRFFNHVGFR